MKTSIGAKALLDGGAREILFTWDTTGSMFPVLAAVRKHVDSTVKRLFDNALNMRIGMLAHGDYCDGPRMITAHELSTNQKSLCDFVRKTEATSGGDAPEAYEQVLRRARSYNWTDGHSKAIVMIGDEVPHPPTYADNKDRVDWKREADALRDLGVKIYSVQCLNRRHATSFYRELAERTGGTHLQLDQFENVTQLLLAVGYAQQGEEQLADFEQEIIKQRKMNRSLDGMFAALRKRKPSGRMAAHDLSVVPPGRFQVLSVESSAPIKEICDRHGVEFKRGRAFYELTKQVTVQGTKEIVLMERETGDLYTGERARELLGLPLTDTDVQLRPVHLETFVPFIQSTSSNRVILGGTRMLYEVPDWSC